MGQKKFRTGQLASVKDVHFELRESLALQMRDMHRLFTRSLERRIATYGIKVSMWNYLRILWEKTQATQKELSEALGIRGPTTVLILASLEKSGLINRQRDQKDRRNVNIRLTTKGIALKQVLLKYAVEVQQLALTDVSDSELKAFSKTLRKMRLQLEKDQSVG